MKTINEIQEEIKNWSYHNFGNHPAYHPLMGIAEEVGELNHHFLKREQNIRTNEDHDEGIEDAIADLMIYLMDFCNCEGIDLNITLNKTWEKVKKRDWKSNDKDGSQ